MDVNQKTLNALHESAVKNKALYEYQRPNAKLLETFATPELPPSSVGVVEITVPEFTSLCPVTGQPDFATIRIKYRPNKLCVESKSLKLYLMGYRQYGSFHETIVSQIAKDLVALLKPRSLLVFGEFAPRGGISFHPTVEYFEADSSK